MKVTEEVTSIADLKHLCVSIIDARKPYGYEYLGNS
jgi:hypothetical protein